MTGPDRAPAFLLFLGSSTPGGSGGSAPRQPGAPAFARFRAFSANANKINGLTPCPSSPTPSPSRKEAVSCRF